jgi:hypothetical protein
MIAKKIGSAIVTEGKRLIGVFTPKRPSSRSLATLVVISDALIPISSETRAATAADSPLPRHLCRLRHPPPCFIGPELTGLREIHLRGFAQHHRRNVFTAARIVRWLSSEKTFLFRVLRFRSSS